jgi:hypothetical protein
MPAPLRYALRDDTMARGNHPCMSALTESAWAAARLNSLPPAGCTPSRVACPPRRCLRRPVLAARRCCRAQSTSPPPSASAPLQDRWSPAAREHRTCVHSDKCERHTVNVSACGDAAATRMAW